MKTKLMLTPIAAAAAGSLAMTALPVNAAPAAASMDAAVQFVAPAQSRAISMSPSTVLAPANLAQRVSYQDWDDDRWDDDDWDDDDDWRERRRDRRWGNGRGRGRIYDKRGRYIEPRRLGRRDRIWRGRDGRYYCRRDNGTTGLVVGAGLGALLGRTIDTRGDRTVGTLLGGALGAVLGREIDRGDVRCR